MIQRIPIDQENDREGWLALRRVDATASTIPALFGVHPYLTAAELYYSKTGVELPRGMAEEMAEWREDLEAVFPRRVRRKRPEWHLEKAAEYLRDPVARIGATPDFYVYGDPRGLGVLQAKTSDRRAFERDWSDGQIPFWIVLQNSVELMLSPTAAFGAVAVITLDAYKSQTEIFDIPRSAAVERKIRDRVAQFWDDVDFGRAPDIDPQRDGGLLSALYPEEVTNKTVDLSGDNYLPALLAERAYLKRQAKPLDDRIEAINREIIAKIGDAERARVGEFTVTYKRASVSARPATPAGLGSRRLNVTDHRKPENDDNGKPF